jgi:hypothetical protein
MGCLCCSRSWKVYFADLTIGLPHSRSPLCRRTEGAVICGIRFVNNLLTPTLSWKRFRCASK